MEQKNPRKHRNILNTKIGLLLVTKDLGKIKKGHDRWWECTCDCGKVITRAATKLIRAMEEEAQSSCGCILQKVKHRGKDPKQASITALYNRAKNTAKHYKRDFSLTKEQYYKLAFGDCYYCKIPPSRPFNIYLTQKGTYRSSHKEWCDQGWVMYSGLDRINSNIGYIDGNVASCCPTCNWAKNDLAHDDFIKWIQKVGEIWKGYQTAS